MRDLALLHQQQRERLLIQVLELDQLLAQEAPFLRLFRETLVEMLLANKFLLQKDFA